jgi:uncharacterized membrane protein YedE/YeeE
VTPFPCKRAERRFGVKPRVAACDNPRPRLEHARSAMQDLDHLPAFVAAAGFMLAVVFGAVAQRVDFCTMGAVTDIHVSNDWRRMRMWLLAIAVAIAGVAALEAGGAIDVNKSIYTGPSVAWASHIVGGFTFGFGMTLASGCGSKMLIRAGAGNLKSIVVLIVLAVSAYMTLKGLFAIWRVNTLDVPRLDVRRFGAAHSDLASVLKASSSLKLALAFAVAAAVATFVFAARDFRRERSMIAGGIVIGAVIVGGWYVTGHLGHLAEDPRTLEEAFLATNSGRPESYSFVAPVAYTLELLMMWSDQSRIVTFGIAGVLGMAVGSAAMALATRRFRWEGFASTEDLVNHIVGGVLMGFGGVTALGCTIGQGLTGISTLAIGSFIALASIIGGCVVALKYQYWRLSDA